MDKQRLRRFWLAFKPWLLLRLRQPSTYVGLIVKLAAIVGLTVTDSGAGQAAEVLAVLIGAALVAWDSTPKLDDTDQAGA